MNSAEQKELEALRRYFKVCENAFGKQHWNADAILDHFNEDGSLKGEGKWRGTGIHAWLLKWQAAQDELNAIEFSGDARSACTGGAIVSEAVKRELDEMLADHGDMEGVLDELLGDSEELPDVDEWDEPKGSCDNCGTNLYADDADDLCGPCEWFAAQNMNPRGDGQ